MAAVNTYEGSSGGGRYSRSNSGGSNGHVGFKVPDSQYSQEREKYLTAKYPKKTMHLIRKRIAVEYYLDEELRRLYGVVSTAGRILGIKVEATAVILSMWRCSEVASTSVSRYIFHCEIQSKRPR